MRRQRHDLTHDLITTDSVFGVATWVETCFCIQMSFTHGGRPHQNSSTSRTRSRLQAGRTIHTHESIYFSRVKIGSVLVPHVPPPKCTKYIAPEKLMPPCHIIASPKVIKRAGASALPKRNAIRHELYECISTCTILNRGYGVICALEGVWGIHRWQEGRLR